MPNPEQVSAYLTCFICYGQPDLEFAKKLVADLEARGVPCWVYYRDATPGAQTQTEIIEKRRAAAKVIVLCSYKSLMQDGLLSEIDDQIRENQQRMIPLSLDELWQHRNYHVSWNARDLKPFLLDKNYADFHDESAYEASLARLFVALERKLTIERGSDRERHFQSTPFADTKVLEKSVASIASLLRLRGEAKNLSFVPQILDLIASVLIIKYDLLPSEQLDEPRVYSKVITQLRGNQLPPPKISQ